MAQDDLFFPQSQPRLPMSEFGSFDSVFDNSANNPLLNDEQGASPNGSSDGAPRLEYEEKTIYVSDEEGPPPELEELNAALQNEWTIQDINLGYHKEEDNYGFVISLARTREPSLFDFAE
jgi:hypothetical protein